MKPSETNQINSVLEWVLQGSTGLPRMLGIRYEMGSNNLIIKKYEGGRPIEELKIHGLRVIKKYIAESNIEIEGGMELSKE